MNRRLDAKILNDCAKNGIIVFLLKCLLVDFYDCCFDVNKNFS